MRFGLFPGQYGMVVYSQFLIKADQIRNFTQLLWKDMPDAMLPNKADGSNWYSPAALGVLRLSSKGHWDIPIDVGCTKVHFLVSHPTPPTFDGPEDRNGKRNHDEIRIWSDYLHGGEKSSYLAKLSKVEKLEPPRTFLFMGDLNADPVDGGSVPGTIQQLLEHPRINAPFVPRSEGAIEASSLQKGSNREHKGNAEIDTADFDERVGNLRVDYILPSTDIQVLQGGVFWPKVAEPLSRLVKMTSSAASSDHRLVYLDIIVP